MDIESWIRSACAQERIDPRDVFWRVRVAANGTLLEASDAAFATRMGSHARTQLGMTLDVATLPRSDLQSKAAWVTASVADVRRQPAHAAEQVTQALQGEVLEPLLHEDGWVLARLPDRYLGWVRDWHLQLADIEAARAHAGRADARIATPLARVRQMPNDAAAACAESVLGTQVVRGASQSGWIEIELPGGRRGWVGEKELRGGPWDASAVSVIEMLQLFLGVPYVWGGKSPKGFDCSGLVQFVYGLHGMSLPRDSDQQFACGEPVSELERGDLLFFGAERVSHVGIALDGRDFIHARGEVRYNSLDPGSSLYAPELAAIFRGGRRILPQRS